MALRYRVVGTPDLNVDRTVTIRDFNNNGAEKNYLRTSMTDTTTKPVLDDPNGEWQLLTGYWLREQGGTGRLLIELPNFGADTYYELDFIGWFGDKLSDEMTYIDNLNAARAESDAQIPLWTSLAGAPAAAPVFSAKAGTYEAEKKITITTETENAKIYYTTDGSDPTIASTLYTGEITIKQNTVLKAIAVSVNGVASEVVSAEYKIVPASTDDTGDTNTDTNAETETPADTTEKSEDTEDTAVEEAKGCGGSIAVGAISVVAVALTAGAVTVRKKED